MIAIGHLDTGVDAAHPLLRDRVGGFLHVDEEGIPRPERPCFDSGKHGTHTAGIIASLAPGARLYAAAVIEGGKTPVRILAGLEWLLEQPIRILCIPLGLRARTPLLTGAMDMFRARGVLPIASVGNGGSSKHHSPGGYDGVLSVGACDGNGAPARFSGSAYVPGTERCHKPDVLAPGVDIVSAAPGGGQLTDSGTSMACAHVAGIAAWLWQHKPEASAEEIEQAMVRTASPLPEASRHRCAGGVLAPEAALAYLREGRYTPSPPSPRPTATKFVDQRLGRKLMFAPDGTELEALVVMRGEGDASIARLVEASLVRSLLGGSIHMVRAEVRLLKAIVAHPAVAIAQSTEVDVV